MLCWYIFITLSRVLSVGVQWGLNECLTTSNGKRKKRREQAGHKESCSALPPFFLLSSFLPLLKREDKFGCRWVVPVLPRGWARTCGVSGFLFKKLQEVATLNTVGLSELSGGPDVLLGGARVTGAVPRPPRTLAVFTCAAQAYTL